MGDPILPITPTQWDRPRTEAVRQALRAAHDSASVSDLLFLEAWEAHGSPDIASTLRASQIRRANPQLAEEIRAELRSASSVSGRPQ
jgi:hypothetical protein